tara:strand:- start:615 stop:941 length:327 start_codon:yes stop_codon:yes gene_type:complete
MKDNHTPMTSFQKWLDTHIEEKDIDTEHLLQVVCKSNNMHLMPVGVVVDYLKHGIDAKEQADVKDILVKIDFRNGDTMHFLNYIAEFIANEVNPSEDDRFSTQTLTVQ